MTNLLLVIFIATAVSSMKNGSPAQLSEFAYIVSIVEGKSHLCSGVIIDESHVLTIAHTIASVSSVRLGVVAGRSSFIASRTYLYAVKEVYIHPSFKVRDFGPNNNTYYDNDIALLRLHEPLYRNAAFTAVSLENTEYDEDNPLNCILISWQAPIDRRRAIILTWEWIQLMDNEVDQQSAEYLGEHEKFFSDIFEGADISEIDLGSPIVCGNFTKGLVVQGEQSAIRGKPSVMISIASYREFIQEVVLNGLFDVELVKYPYVASIWAGNTHVCGGFILNLTHIATAGQCVAYHKVTNYTVAVGYLAAPAQWLSIAHITIHPGYHVESSHLPSAWYIDHDFAILTLAGTISWSKGARPLTLPESDDLYEGEICEVLRWKCCRDEITGVDAIKLKRSRVVLMDECSRLLLDPSTQFQVPSFWGRSQYLMPIADSRDVGNPIICRGSPVGFLIQAVSIHGDFSARTAKFLKIRPYMESSLHTSYQNG